MFPARRSKPAISLRYESASVSWRRLFEAIGIDLRNLSRAEHIISADVLDAWFDPSPRVLQLLKEHLPFLLRTSPPNHAEGLVGEIAARRGVPPECVLPGAGSSSLLFLLLPRLLREGARVLLPDPMYGEYSHIAGSLLQGECLSFVLQPEEKFELRAAALTERALQEKVDAVIVVNPNNPTGRLCPRPDLLAALDCLPASTLMLVDETYIDYAGSEHSLETEAARRNNLVVLKSMSKVYALSGERVAYLVANPSTAERLRLYLPPWPVGLSAQAAAMEALRDPDYYCSRYRETEALRNRFSSALKTMPGLDVFPSEANFFLVRTTQAAALAAHLERQGIFVRRFPPGQTSLGEEFLRFSVKDAARMERMISAVRSFLT